MRQDHPTLHRLRGEATAVGEIGDVTAETITIKGDFPPGLAIALHRGARVFLLAEDDAIDIVTPSGCDCGGL